MTRATESAGSPQAEKALLDYLGRPGYRPVPQRELLHLMHVGPAERPLVRRLIRRLRDEGRIVRLSRGRLALPGRRSERGPHPAARDRPPAPRKGTRLLGLVEQRQSGWVARPFDKSFAEPVHIPASFLMGARDRQAVEIELLRDPRPGRWLEGRVLEVLGELDEPGTDLQIVIRRHGLRTEMPRSVVAAAGALPSRIGPKESARRTRFDDPAPVTIDGETAKDFDDAIAVKPLRNGGFRLFVHIADVSHFVRPGDELDREARRRGTSVYFPHRVLPMFPEKISNDLCSLRPGVDRLVQSVIVDIDAKGRPGRTRFADGVIHSAARLTYTQVAEVLAGKSRVRGVPRGVVSMLQAAGELREVLEARRAARGSVDFDLPEPQILLDVEGAMTGIQIEPRNEAHRLIEECMILANEAVAGELERRKRPCMYRIHESPDPLKIEGLASFVALFGLRLDSPAEGIRPEAIGNLMQQAAGKPEQPVVAQMVLRSMKQARYSLANHGHFGLASETYCHFTSPIRRYPDLVVHRLLRAARRGAAVGEDGGASEEVALQSSELERNAEAAERELLQWKKLAFIQDEIGGRFWGVVTGVTAFGLFVQLEANLVEGLVHVERLGEERFEFDARRMELRGQRTGLAYRMGKRLEVRVDRVDRILRRVDFSLADDEMRTTRREWRSTRKEAPARRQRRRPGRGRRGRRF